MIEQRIETTKGVFDWFLNKKQTNQVVILLTIIICFIGWYLNDRIEILETKIEKQTMIIEELKVENTSLKYQGLLLLDAYKDDPNPRWITEASTNRIVSINDAYEKKYLKPLGFTKMDLLYTDGSAVFGEKKVAIFNQNNQIVVRLGKPQTFQNEINTTLKFPIGKNNFIYAIGGYEYLQFN